MPSIIKSLVVHTDGISIDGERFPHYLTTDDVIVAREHDSRMCRVTFTVWAEAVEVEPGLITKQMGSPMSVADFEAVKGGVR